MVDVLPNAKPALEPAVDQLLLLERARLFTALLRALADYDAANSLLIQLFEQAKRRFQQGAVPKNSDEWLKYSKCNHPDCE